MQTTLQKFGLYSVVLLEDREEHNYGVYNEQTKCVEYRCRTFPQAQGTAAQFNYMVEHQSWRDLLNSLFGGQQQMDFFMPDTEREADDEVTEDDIDASPPKTRGH